MQKDFSRELIKGKIAEIIFEQMFGEQGNYTVIPFGYEKIFPEIINQKNNLPGAKKAIDNIRNAPDYAIISQNKEKVYLVEVKYRKVLDVEKLIELAKKQIERWHPSCIFLATFDGFYFDLCSNIIKNKRIPKLREIDNKLQEKYLKLLREFER